MKRVDRLDVQHLNAVLDDRTRGVARMSSVQTVYVTTDPTVIYHDLNSADTDYDVCFSPLSVSPLEFTLDLTSVGGALSTVTIGDATPAIYATESDRKTWTPTAAIIRSTFAASVRVWFVARGK